VAVTDDLQLPVERLPEAPTGSFPGLCSPWFAAPPLLRGIGVTLREVTPSDAPGLLAAVGYDAVAGVLGAAPATLEELAGWLKVSRAERCLGHELCLTVVPDDCQAVVGLFRVREAEPGFGSAEWQFVVAPEYWGRGLFFRAAPLVVDFVFDVVGAHRLEARAATHNGRGTGALRKLGAVREAVLRESIFDRTGYADQGLWTIVAEDWYARTGYRRPIH
jgi:RimJ/RimL family protein N-acetyltransferase